MTRETRAIVVGVDGYSFRPLASAVRDAVAVRDVLTHPLPGEVRPLVAEEDVTLLTTPARGEAAPAGSLPATQDAILAALEAFYKGAETAPRLIFYFAGHGLSGSRDGRVREPLIVPADVRAPNDGSRMICLDDLLALFAERGPLQQLWIMDACRDMPYARRPRGYEIAWNPEEPQGPRSQVAIFAVAAGGQALSQQGGHGHFTTHLLDGLRGTASAADYIQGRGDCVTAESLHAYVHRRILRSLEGYDEWTRTVQAPELRTSGPRLEPLRMLPPRRAREFTVQWRPPEARDVVDVALEVQAGIPVAGWPPMAIPRVYELRASLKRGMDEFGWREPKPSLLAVDLREDDHVTIDVPRDRIPRRTDAGVVGMAGPRPYRVTTDDRGITELVTSVRREDRAATAGKMTCVRVQADDSAACVFLRRAEHPWTVREREPTNTDIEVEPGTWDVQTRIGDELISATRVVLAPGQTRVVTAVAQISPAVASLLPPRWPSGGDETPPRTVMPSETIGPMQGAILPTLLPLLALKPFDPGGTVLRQLSHLQIPLHDPAAPTLEPRCAVAVALEGAKPPGERPVVVDGARVWASADGRVSVHALPVDRQRRTVGVELHGARIDVAAPQLASGVTAVAVTAWRDGTVHASVGMFRMPLGLAWPQPAGDRVPLPPGRLARALALAAPLFSAGADLQAVPDGSLNEFAVAKWIDPVLGAVAFHSCRNRLRALPSDADPAVAGSLRRLRDTIQINLTRHFGSLPDSRIIAALHDEPGRQRQEMAQLLTDPGLGQPVLIASLADLADAARASQLHDHWSLDRIEHVVLGQVFNMTVTAH